MDFVLALRKVFLHGGVIIVQVFSYTIVDKACGAPDVLLVAVVTRDLVNRHNLVLEIGQLAARTSC